MTEYQVQGSGISADVHSRQIHPVPDFDKRKGEHLWTVLACYQVKDPTAENLTLDHENLLTVAGPGCYYCEQPYSDRMKYRRCRGHG